MLCNWRIGGQSPIISEADDRTILDPAYQRETDTWTERGVPGWLKCVSPRQSNLRLSFALFQYPDHRIGRPEEWMLISD